MQKTIIQNTAVQPYIDLYTFNFLYTPISSTIWVYGKEHFINEMYDRIEDNGTITRRIRINIAK